MILPLDFNLIGKMLDFFWKHTYRLYKEAPFETSDYMVSLDWISDFGAFSRQLPEGTIELVVHLEREEDYRAMLEYF